MNRVNATAIKAPSKLQQFAYSKGYDSVTEMFMPLILAAIAAPFIYVFIVLLMSLPELLN